MVAGTWTRTHDLLTKFLEDFYNLLSFSMLKVLARHLNFQTVTFCVTPIFVSFHRHQIWWKNNFILIWLLSFSFYLEQKSAFWLWNEKCNLVEHRVQRLGLRQGQGRVARIPRGNRQTLSVMTFFYLKARSVGLCKMQYDRELSNWPSLYCTKFGSTLLRFTQQITQILIEP